MPILTSTEPLPGYRHVTIDNPPINLFDPDFVGELRTLLDDLESDETVKIVVFESADPEYFISHIDLARADEFGTDPEPATGLSSWPDAAVRLERAPFLTVGVIRGRARGVGSEFLLALDVRFASREEAILCQPELGFGFVPGGGGLERLSLNTGRARALEIIIGAMDYDADTAERYGWINRSLPDAELDEFVRTFARRVATFDRAAIAAAKQTVTSHGGVPEISWFSQSQEAFYALLANPESQALIKRFFEAGLQKRGDFETNLADRMIT